MECDLGDGMSKEFWSGATWVYQADITNGAGGAGNHVYTIVPGAGNELQILYGRVLNGDTSSRTATAVIDDGTNELTRFMTLALTAGSAQSFPNAEIGSTGGGSVADGPRFILSGTMRLVVTIAAVAASENTAFGLVCRIVGGVPTVTEAGASTPTINVNTEQVF